MFLHVPYYGFRNFLYIWYHDHRPFHQVTPTIAFLMRQLIVSSRLGRTEYQLLLMKISWWDRNVTNKVLSFGCDIWIFYFVLLYQPNEFISQKLWLLCVFSKPWWAVCIPLHSHWHHSEVRRLELFWPADWVPAYGCTKWSLGFVTYQQGLWGYCLLIYLATISIYRFLPSICCALGPSQTFFNHKPQNFNVWFEPNLVSAWAHWLNVLWILYLHFS